MYPAHEKREAFSEEPILTLVLLALEGLVCWMRQNPSPIPKNVYNSITAKLYLRRSPRFWRARNRL